MSLIDDCRPKTHPSSLTKRSSFEGSGDMVIKRGRTGHTYNGVSNPVAISAIQKYIRRGNVEKATWIAAGVDLEGLAHDDTFLDKYMDAHPEAVRKTVISQSKALRTNMYNRLRMIVSEDICVGCLEAPVIVEKFLHQWVATRTTAYPNGNHHELLQAVQYMCDSKHVRYVSCIKTFYDLPPYYHKYEDNKMGVTRLVYERAREYLTAKYPEKMLPIGIPPSDDETPVKLAGELFTLFTEQLLATPNAPDYRAFYWLGKYFRSAGYLPSQSHGRIVKFIKSQRSTVRSDICKSIDVLLSWYKDRVGKTKEAITFLYHCMILILHREDPRLQVCPAASLLTREETTEIYQNTINGERHEIDEYVVDRHTGARGKSGSLAYFAKQGAFVENKSVFYSKEDEDIYIEMKMLLDSGAAATLPPSGAIPGVKIKCGAAPPREAIRGVKIKLTKPVRPVRAKLKLKLKKLSTPLSPPLLSQSLSSPEAIDKTISDGYMAQKRTSSQKKATYMSPDLVVKGPYSASSGSFKLHKKSYQMFCAVEEILELPAELRTTIHTDIYENKDGHWLVMPNLGNFDAGCFHESDTKLDGTINVIKPDGTGARGNSHLHQILSKVPNPSREACRAALQHIYIRLILGIGDAGIHNMLLPLHRAPGQIVVGYDFEEERSYSKFKLTLDLSQYHAYPKLHVLFQKKKIASKNVLVKYIKYIRDIRLMSHEQGVAIELSEESMERLDALNHILLNP